MTLSKRTGQVYDSVTVTLSGYGAGQSVLVTFDSGAGIRSVVRVRASSTGVATTSFVVPPSTRGTHKVAATDDAGHTTSVSFETRQRVEAGSPAEAGQFSGVGLTGFAGGEIVELRWGSSTGAC